MSDAPEGGGTVWFKIPLGVLRWSIGGLVFCSVSVAFHFANLFLIWGDDALAGKFSALGNGFLGVGMFCFVMQLVRIKRLGRPQRFREDGKPGATE